MKTDTLIIGSGVAATAVATKLLDHNPEAEILVLEAGPKVKMRDFALFQEYLVTNNLPYEFCEDLNYPSRDKPGENLNIGETVVPLRGSRLMIYGGSTVHWGGWSFRLKPEDFRLQSETGKGIDWPIDYEELEPFYGQAEHFIGVSGDSENQNIPRTTPYPYPAFPYTLEDSLMIEALEELDLQYNAMPIARHGITDTDSPHAPCQTTGTCKYCPFGARFVAGNFLDDMLRLEHHPNFDVRYNKVVQELIVSSKDRVDGVVYYDKDTGETKTVTANRVILAAGAIESPKLLMRSTSEFWPNGVGNDEDLVGRNLITHPYFIFQATLPENPEKLQAEMNFPTLVSRYYDSKAEQKKGKFILVHPPSTPEFAATNSGINISNLVEAMQNGVTREEINEMMVGKTYVQIHGIIEIFSEYKNRVMNFDKVNHLGLKETIVDYTQDPEFNARMEEVKGIVNTIFEAMGATGTTRVMLSWRADHSACTTRMSDTPDIGVVDKNLQVHGINNLFIPSNGSFSSLGAVNPTLTLAALSLRLGDHLIQQINHEGEA